MSDTTTEVIIFALYGDAYEQGKEKARLTVSRYNKWPSSAAFEKWVLDAHPPAGRYAAVALEGGGHRYLEGTMKYGQWATMNIFTVSYPEAIVKTNGDSRPIGCRS